METILNFLVDNYLWFLIISLILIFGLIGYIVDTHEKKTPKLHFGDEEDLNMETLVTDETKSLKELLEETETIEEVPEITPVNPVNAVEPEPAIEPINNTEENIQNELPKE